MTKIHLVGCGQLGFQLAQEIAKRAQATDKHLELYLYDDDTVEDRNTYSQGFSPRDIGKLKAEVAGEITSGYENVKVVVRPWRVTAETLDDMELDSDSILIDAVDNIDTRHFLWDQGLKGTPVLHLGISEFGNGSVSWNWKDYDKFPLSPNNMVPETLLAVMDRRESGEKEKEIRLPPCELNSSRSLGLNTVHAGLDALWLYLGRDSAGILPPQLKLLQSVPGCMTNWETSKTGRQMLTTAKDDIYLAGVEVEV